MGINFTDIAITDPVIAATINDRLDQLDAAIVAGLGGVTLTNKSGGSLAANDAVVVDTANNEAVTTTTSAGNINRPAIVLAGGANNAEVTVSFLGEVTVVVDAAGTRGQWIKTSTTAKRVTPVGSLDVGVFGILTANSGGGAGTTAKALLLGQVVTAPGSHTHAAADIISGLLALARGGTAADLSATGPGYLRQASGGAVVTVGSIAAGDLPAATDSAQGAVELATTAETQTGTDAARAVTPAAAAAAYFLRALFINTSAGATDAGKPIVLDASGKIASTMIAPSTIDHNQLLNLALSDPHTQYILKSLLTTKGDIIVRDASGPQRLAAGASGQILAIDATEPTGLKWIPPLTGGSGIPVSTMDFKGDLLVGTADDTVARLGVGGDGQFLMAASNQATGLLWSNLPLSNYIITPSVASNNLTVALKTLAGTDPTTVDNIPVRIGNSMRYVTSALSVTANAGTNWCAAGSSELATKDIDYFVYLIQETGAAAGTKIGFSRIPYARLMGDFVNTPTNSRYIIGNHTNFNSTDEVTLIGRFNATLSAAASYNWSISSAVVINRPIFETRFLSWAPTVAASSGSITTVGTVTANYQINNRLMVFYLAVTITTNGTGAGTLTTTLPISSSLNIVSPGREAGVSGKTLAGFGGAGSTISWVNYDNTYPMANGAILIGGGPCAIA